MSERRRSRGGGHAGHARDGAAHAIAPDALAHPAQPRPPHRAAAARGRRRHPRRRHARARGDRHRLPQPRGPRLSSPPPAAASTASPSAWTAPSSWSRCAKAPRQFDITPRNPARRVTMGGGHMCFVNVSSPPNAMDLDRGRRVGNMEDFKNFMRLTQYFNCIHVAGGYPVEPVDIHASRPPPRLPLREAHPHRQGRPRLQPRRRAGRGRDRDGPHRLRPRRRPSSRASPASSPTSTPPRPLKHDFPDARRRHALRPPRPAGHRHPLHAGRRHGPGHHGRRRRPLDRRGAGRHRPPAGHPPRRRPA